MGCFAQLITESDQQTRDRYDTGIISGALLWEDSRVLAALLLSNHSLAEIRGTVVDTNALLRKTKKRSLNVTSYLLHRLRRCPKMLLEIIATADSISSRQATFISAVISSRFLRDFLNEVVCERLGSFNHTLPELFWNDFWFSCVSKEPDLNLLRPKGISEIRATLLKFLAEIGILDDIRSRELRKIPLSPQVLSVFNSYELSWIKPYLRSFLR